MNYFEYFDDATILWPNETDVSVFNSCGLNFQKYTMERSELIIIAVKWLALCYPYIYLYAISHAVF